MKQISIPVKPENKLNIKATEDLFIEGTETGLLIAVVRHSDSFRYTETAGKIEVKTTSDCHLQIPSLMSVTIEKAGGDVSITGLKSRVIVGKVGGDLIIQNLDGASIETIGGDLHVHNPGNAVEVVRVGGDIYGSQIHAISTRSVGSDARLFQIDGEVNLKVGGDAELEFIQDALPKSVLTTGGDARIVVPPIAQGQLELHSGGNNIEVSAAGQDGDWELEQLSLPLGEGGNQVNITAGGDIFVTDKKTSESDFDEVFHRSINDWKSFGADLEKQIRESVGVSVENMRWATRSANLAGEKTRAKIEKAMRKLESGGVIIDHTGVNVERNGKHVGITFGTPVAPKEPPRAGSSDEERLLVLKMLQEKKITAEEADKLLSALDK